MLCSLRHGLRGPQTVSVKCLGREGLPVNMATVITPSGSAGSLYDKIASQAPVVDDRPEEDHAWKGIHKSRVQTISVCNKNRVEESRSRL